MEPFGTRLSTAMAARGHLCIGIDPHASLLHEWGLEDDPAGLERFAMTCVEALGGTVAVLKPQSAFFERHGSAGIAVLERVVRAARGLGALVLLDAKRGDIGSTMQGYAEAYLDQTAPMAVDALTVSPYLGFESLRPVFDVATPHGAGVFVLALTSNPGGSQVQQAATGAGTVASAMLRAVAAENQAASPMGSVGAVVAANLESTPESLDVNGPLLAPGFGAQGGSGKHLSRVFAGVGRLVLPSTSRQVLAQGPSTSGLQRAAARAASEVEAALGSSRV